MTAPDRDLQAAIATTRFGMGARPGEIAQARADPQGYLAAQIVARDPPPPRALPQERVEAVQAFREAQQRFLKLNQAGDRAARDLRPDVAAKRRAILSQTSAEMVARAARGAATEASFVERWALFWSNHFTVATSNIISVAVTGPYEAGAIRPHIFGRFEDLLVTAETHPAMLLYLDQNSSVGPDSPLARRAAARDSSARQLGLNENLAREILELHTVGVDGGYSQTDVTEFARALTGLGFRGFQADPREVGETYFRRAAHDPGAKSIMGVTYRSGDGEDARTILRDLAARPQTARFISRKIARHFVADDPPPALCERLESAWRGSDGDLSEVARALITAPEAWDAKPRKFKTPYEFALSTWRATATGPRTPQDLAMLTGMGHRPFAAPSPEGWPDEEAAWATPDGVIKRLVWVEQLAPQAIGQGDPSLVAQEALGARLTPATARAVRRAESRAEGLALLLMSPEFQRR